ncbi:Dihydrofolate reductase, partial [uncultured Rubrobacteraceae bacterium]
CRGEREASFPGRERRECSSTRRYEDVRFGRRRPFLPAGRKL